jgi:alanyl-tRNA synthetase
VQQRENAKNIKLELKTKITAINGIHFLGEILDLKMHSIKDILFQLKEENPNFIGVIGNTEGDKCFLSLIVSDNLVAEKNLNASQIIRQVSKHIEGGGGGQAFFATSGGKRKEGLVAAIQEIKSLF